VCEDSGVDDHEQRELRRWADQLVAAPDAERRAMGRAILMLLGQVAVLQAELARCAQDVLDRDQDVVRPPSVAAEIVEHAAGSSLHKWVREATRHLRRERRT
jgi:hypothetical protein